MEEIKIQGARIHNLKNISLSIPKHQLIAITGISGSGKSSLAFDILFEEGKNQYLSSIGILPGLDNEDRFDSIEGIGPTVSVRQNTIRQSNPRSTVGSKTGLLNQLALLYASESDSLNWLGEHFSPGAFLYTTSDGMCLHCQGRGAYYAVNLKKLVPDETTLLSEVYKQLHVTMGFLRLLKKKYGAYFQTPFWKLPEDIFSEVVYGTYENGRQSYCVERILRGAFEKGEDVESVYAQAVCPKCHGDRVNEETRKVFIHGRQIGELGRMSLTQLDQFLKELPTDELSNFGRNTVKRIIGQLDHLIKFRLGHLSLYREMSTLSGGELQRLFLHLHLESGLDSLIYLFDEPMAGLHASEKESMFAALKALRDRGNTVIVVEHDEGLIRQADHIIEIGPKAGCEGGEVVFQGSAKDYLKADTLLSRYISGKQQMPERTRRKLSASQEDCLFLSHACCHYLKDISAIIPLHCMVGIAGLSGSGKSSLIEETLLKRLASAKKYGQAEGLEGAEKISGFTEISQEPIGRSASSTPASYIGIWDKIRELYAKQPEAVKHAMTPGHFSFHSKGACPVCGGSGYEKIYLTALFSVDKLCKACQGKRFNEESLSVTYKGKTISDVLKLSISEAVLFFKDQPSIIGPLRLLEQMGMGYLKLGQPTSSLSGGEAQRVKLAKELGRAHKGNMLYVLDEPTTGLSLYDTALLLRLLDQLVESGHTVLVIEHNTEVLKQCDYLIELGPEGGEKGGSIIAQGTPQSLICNPNSMTGKYLA